MRGREGEGGGGGSYLLMTQTGGEESRLVEPLHRIVRVHLSIAARPRLTHDKLIQAIRHGIRRGGDVTAVGEGKGGGVAWRTVGVGLGVVRGGGGKGGVVDFRCGDWGWAILGSRIAPVCTIV